jgi:hypothetical protein
VPSAARPTGFCECNQQQQQLPLTCMSLHDSRRSLFQQAADNSCSCTSTADTLSLMHALQLQQPVHSTRSGTPSCIFSRMSAASAHVHRSHRCLLLQYFNTGGMLMYVWDLTAGSTHMQTLTTGSGDQHSPSVQRTGVWVSSPCLGAC